MTKRSTKAARQELRERQEQMASQIEKLRMEALDKRVRDEARLQMEHAHVMHRLIVENEEKRFRTMMSLVDEQIARARENLGLPPAPPTTPPQPKPQTLPPPPKPEAGGTPFDWTTFMKTFDKNVFTKVVDLKKFSKKKADAAGKRKKR